MEKKNNWLNILKKILIATGIVVIISVITTIGIGNYFVNYAILRTGNGGDREVKNKEVIVNYDVMNKNSYILKENDIFSIRRYGKYKFVGIVKSTKKNNFIVRYLKYI